MKTFRSNQSWRRLPWTGILVAQIGLLILVAASASTLNDRGIRRLGQTFSGEATAPRLPIPRKTPLRVTPFYDDPQMVSDEELLRVLEKVRPSFPTDRLAPNFVEHALRAWGSTIEFNEPGVMDGPELVEYLTDYGSQMASFRGNAAPLFAERADGLAVNWGNQPGESVHHDHWLACLTEAGAPLDTPIFGPNRKGHTLNDALQEALRDFEPNERETEWSVMAFGFWLPPEHQSWTNRDGRKIDFNMLADVLMRGDLRYGVCGGTHRVYSLMVLLRLDDDHELLEPSTREAVYNHLRSIRDRITLSQYPDGHWGSDWPDGSRVANRPLEEPHYRKVIATGHQLEWLALAYEDLLPPRENIHRAARWLIDTVRDTPQEEIHSQYTFYSHVGNALALWRKTTPPDAWRKLAATRPPAAPPAPTLPELPPPPPPLP